MTESHSPQKKLFVNASLLFSGKAAAGGFAALQTVVLARILGVTDYGLLQLVIAYIAMMNQFFDVRVWETAVKYIGSYWENGEADKTLAMIKLSYILDVGSGAVSFVIAIVTAKLISTYVIHSPEAYIYIWIYAVGLFVETAKLTSDAILRVFERYKLIAVINSLENLIQLVLVTALLLAGLGIKGALYALIISNFIAAAVRLWAVMRVLAEKNSGTGLPRTYFSSGGSGGR